MLTAAILCVLLPSHSLLAERGCAVSWMRKPGLNEIGLLPFPMADGLLPGESLQIHLSASSSLALFETSMRRDHGCVAQLVERAEGSVCAVAPLLELREHRKHESAGVWCSYACVGAVQISDVELRTAAEEAALSGEAAAGEAADEPFLVAKASMLREASGGVNVSENYAVGNAPRLAPSQRLCSTSAAPPQRPHSASASPPSDFDGMVAGF